MTHPPGNPQPSDPGGGDGTTGPGRTLLLSQPDPHLPPGAPHPDAPPGPGSPGRFRMTGPATPDPMPPYPTPKPPPTPAHWSRAAVVLGLALFAGAVLLIGGGWTG